MFHRNLTESLKAALSDNPVVLLLGARQVGKSTLVQNLANVTYGPQYLTFDDATILAAVAENPTAFLETVQKPVIFDEVQRVPELFIALKASVNKNRISGNFLLTGSANVLLMPKIADSLAGRMELITLRPLSQGELTGRKEDFIDWVCGDTFNLPRPFDPEDREDLFQRMLAGGYPEAVRRISEGRRSKWFRSYITTLLQRDVRDLSNIEGLTDLPRLFSILAARTGGLLNFAEISRSGGHAQTTLKRYITLLEQLFLIELLPAYSGNLTKRLVKSPKLFFTDTGLLSELQGLSWSKIKFENSFAGMLMENFVVGELRAQAGWNKTPVEMFHFRTAADQEVDIVLELPTSEVIGIEVKSGASVGAEAFRGLKQLESDLGKKFKRGIVIYTGEKSVSFGKKLFAVPIQALWAERR